jgi:DNA-binding NarL/FixJ family response regulator
MALAATASLDRRRELALTAPRRQPRPLTRALVLHRADIVRAGIASLLSTGGPFDVAEGASIFEGLRLFPTSHAQVILFEFELGEGAEACRLLAGQWPRPKLIALVSRSRAVPPHACLDAGADAAIAIDGVSRENFVLAVQRTLDGLSPVVAGFRPTAELPVAAAIDDALTVLTPREREILYLIGQGLTNKEIADGLVLSIKTIEAHRANLSRKLNVRPRASLIRLAIGGARA